MSWWQPLRDTVVQKALGIPRVLQRHLCDSRASLRERRLGGTNVDITRCAEITGGFVNIVNVLAGNCNTGNVEPLSYLEATEGFTAQMKDLGTTTSRRAKRRRSGRGEPEARR